MNPADDRRRHLDRLITVVDREDHHLLAVRTRLLGSSPGINAEWVKALISDEAGIDRLESFGAKFGRMQDTVVDKLVPAVLRAAGERTAAAIDNLERMERLGLITRAEDWIEMRWLRNRLVHEYIDRPEDLAPALERACRFTDVMHADYGAIRDYAINHLSHIR